MIDLLFVELGAVVTEILGSTRCTIEPFCHPTKPPTYSAEDRLEVDFAFSLAGILSNGSQEPTVTAVQRALYHQYDQIDGLGSVPIGPSWPGGGYEGIVNIREDIVRANAKLAAAAAILPGRPWEHQVVTSIDEVTGKILHYHGFHAEIIEDEGNTLVLKVAHAGKSMDPPDPDSPWKKVRYSPADTTRFYTGALIANNLIRGGEILRRSGAVFITLEEAANSNINLPKLPPGAGL